jgi:HprK-related kinase A
VKLSTWSRHELAERLRKAGVFLHTGPFLSRVRSGIPAVVDGIALLYADYRVSQHADFADFHIALTRPHGLRRWLRPQMHFEFDGVFPFKPLPLAQALPMLEWGLNWCIGNHAHQFLILHAAAIEKNGRAAILPGPAGAGKSTLTAYLVHNGWRLLSDELALLSLADGCVTALARPISLKNQSIDIIERAVPRAIISRRCEDTAKGTVALLKAPSDSVAQIAETARPAWVIFPRYQQGVAASFTPRSKADTLIEVGQNAFNYSIHGKLGFEMLSRLMDDCACYDLSYSDLDQAREIFEALEPAGALAREASA